MLTNCYFLTNLIGLAFLLDSILLPFLPYRPFLVILAAFAFVIDIASLTFVASRTQCIGLRHILSFAFDRRIITGLVRIHRSELVLHHLHLLQLHSLASLGRKKCRFDQVERWLDIQEHLIGKINSIGISNLHVINEPWYFGISWGRWHTNSSSLALTPSNCFWLDQPIL